MVVNTLQTDDARNARPALLAFGRQPAASGALPAWWLWRQPARRPSSRCSACCTTCARSGLAAGTRAADPIAVFADFSSTNRNHKELRYLVTRSNAVYSIGAVAFQRQAAPKGPPAVIGADARLLPRPEGAKPPLLMLVVGETRGP